VVLHHCEGAGENSAWYTWGLYHYVTYYVHSLYHCVLDLGAHTERRFVDLWVI